MVAFLTQFVVVLVVVAVAASAALDDDFPFCAQVFFVVCTNSFCRHCHKK